MVIKFSKEEVKELQTIMETSDPGSVELMKETLQDTNIIKFRVLLCGGLEVTVNSDYTAEFLNVYSRYLGLLIPQVKAFMATVELFTLESQAIVDKYMGDNKSC